MTTQPPPAGAAPASDVYVFWCHGLGCLQGLIRQMGRDGAPPTTVSLDAGWTMASSWVWCPEHRADGARFAAVGCDSCPMPEGHHASGCLRVSVERNAQPPCPIAWKPSAFVLPASPAPLSPWTGPMTKA